MKQKSDRQVCTYYHDRNNSRGSFRWGRIVMKVLRKKGIHYSITTPVYEPKLKTIWVPKHKWMDALGAIVKRRKLN